MRQPSCRLQVHIPADVQVCWQPPIKHGAVQSAEENTVHVCKRVCAPTSIVKSWASLSNAWSTELIYHDTGAGLSVYVQEVISQSQGMVIGESCLGF